MNNKEWDDDIVQCLRRTVAAEWLRALIHVVPKGAGDKLSRECYAVRALCLEDLG